ncbi:cyclic nucleotide-binding domain-containing protein [Nitrospinota bacterium]
MLSTIEKALFLKSINLFESMSPEQLKILSNISEEMTFNTGDVLFNEGDPADYLYIIVDGEIEIIKNHASPQQVRLAVLGTKASFGEMAIFGSEGRSATAVASMDSSFLAMRKEHLLLLIQENPTISTAIVFQLANIIRENNRQKAILESNQLNAEAGESNKSPAAEK